MPAPAQAAPADAAAPPCCASRACQGRRGCFRRRGCRSSSAGKGLSTQRGTTAIRCNIAGYRPRHGRSGCSYTRRPALRRTGSARFSPQGSALRAPHPRGHAATPPPASTMTRQAAILPFTNPHSARHAGGTRTCRGESSATLAQPGTISSAEADAAQDEALAAIKAAAAQAQARSTWPLPPTEGAYEPLPGLVPGGSYYPVSAGPPPVPVAPTTEELRVLAAERAEAERAAILAERAQARERLAQESAKNRRPRPTPRPPTIWPWSRRWNSSRCPVRSARCCASPPQRMCQLSLGQRRGRLPASGFRPVRNPKRSPPPPRKRQQTQQPQTPLHRHRPRAPPCPTSAPHASTQRWQHGPHTAPARETGR